MKKNEDNNEEKYKEKNKEDELVQSEENTEKKIGNNDISINIESSYYIKYNFFGYFYFFILLL